MNDRIASELYSMWMGFVRLTDSEFWEIGYRTSDCSML